MKLFKQIRELIRLKKYYYSIDLINTRKTTISEEYSIQIINTYTGEKIYEYYILYDFELCKSVLIASYKDNVNNIKNDDYFLDDIELKGLIFKFLLNMNGVKQ